MYFDKRLCMFHQIFATQDELFETMFKTMFQAGVVKSDYLEGIKEREEEYPTGLLINDIGFAIPHTDSSKVNYSQICFASLNQPVEFLNMGDKNEKIKVELVQILQNLIALFQNKEAINALKQCENEEEFMGILNRNGIY